MATSERRRDRALRLARRLRSEIGTQIRVARVDNGVSLRAAAQSVGMDYSVLGRIERGEIDGVSIEQVVLACVAVGLEPSSRGNPRGDLARDAGHLRLLARFRARLPASTDWHTEVPIPLPGDLRALDGRFSIGRSLIGVEAETHLGDLQAIGRRSLLKKRDGGIDVLILLVADTRWNRDVLALHREAMRGSFPLDTREMLASVGGGRVPRADGIIVL